MPARYGLTSSPETVRAAFGLADIEAFPERPAIAPTEPVLIVRRGLRMERQPFLVRWGLIPGWVKDPSTISTLFVARAETAADKPSFRGGLRHRRCLVPADGFYAWSGEKGARKAHYFQKQDGALLAMAGIWEHWIGVDGSEVDTMAVLTVAANEDVGRVTDRMPMLIDAADFTSWLDCRDGESVSVAPLMARVPDVALQMTDVAGPLPRGRLKGLA